MYNKLGNYQDDGRGQYNFTYTDNEGKHVSVSFRADNNYDLDIIFNEFRNFLLAANHDIEGEIGELFHDAYEDDLKDEEESLVEPPFNYNEYDGPIKSTILEPENKLMKTQVHKDKFSMDHLPNNGWPFGTLATTDLSSLNVSRDWGKINQYPTMSPLTTEQIEALTFKMPGTTGGAKVSFK